MTRQLFSLLLALVTPVAGLSRLSQAWQKFQDDFRAWTDLEQL